MRIYRRCLVVIIGSLMLTGSVYARCVSVITFLPRPIQRFAGVVFELGRTAGNPVGGL
jgi:hypothetical protein